MTTNKQNVWLEEYFKCWNATEAARRAGYANPNTAGPRLLLNDGIKEKIQSRLNELVMSSDEVLIALSEIAHGTIEDFMNVKDDGKLEFDFKKAKETDKLKLINRVTPTREGLKVELQDRMKALELIGRHHGLFKDTIEVTGKDGTPLIDNDRYDRAISTLADAVREGISGKAPEQDGAVGSSE